MNAIELLEEIFTKKIVYDEQGNEYQLDSNIDQAEGGFLTNLIKKYQPKKSIEIGCAHGISSLYICSELGKIPGAHHTIIDPLQSTYFHNVGISNLKKAGFHNFELIEGLSEIELPRLLSKEKKFDFCFIDGNHTFDHTLLDFFYLNRMIDIGGIIVFDDTGFPGINKLMRYILNYPSYEQIGHVPYKFSNQRLLFDKLVQTPFRFFSRLIPGKLRYEVFASNVITSNKTLNLNASMMAFQKIKNDDRSWNWYKEF